MCLPIYVIEKLCETREGRNILRSQARKKARASEGERVPWHPRIRELHARLEERTPPDRRRNPVAKFKSKTIKDAVELAQAHDIEPYSDAAEIRITTSTDTVVLDYDDGEAPERLVLADLYDDLGFEFAVALAKAMKLRVSRDDSKEDLVYKAGKVRIEDAGDGIVELVSYDRGDATVLWEGSPVDEKAAYMKALAKFAK